MERPARFADRGLTHGAGSGAAREAAKRDRLRARHRLSKFLPRGTEPTTSGSEKPWTQKTVGKMEPRAAPLPLPVEKYATAGTGQSGVFITLRAKYAVSSSMLTRFSGGDDVCSLGTKCCAYREKQSKEAEAFWI